MRLLFYATEPIYAGANEVLKDLIGRNI